MTNTKILFVDDLVDITEYYMRYFTRRGMTVYTANSVELGVEVFNKERPQIVFTDLRMDDLGGAGIRLLKKIREIDANCYCFVLTGSTAEFSKLDEAETLNAQYLFKPKTPEQIYEIIKPLIEKINSI